MSIERDNYIAGSKVEIDTEYVPQRTATQKPGTIACTVFLLITGIAAVILRVQMDVLSVYQLLSVVTCLILFQTLLSVFVPSAYDQFFAAKTLITSCMLVAVFFLPSYFPLSYYVTTARAGGFAFVFIQQLLLLDFAFSWNREWVNMRPSGRRILSGMFAGTDIELLFNSPWLLALVVVSLIYGGCFIAMMSYLYTHFGGDNCSDSSTIIWITVSLMLLALILQLRGSHGSLLTSGIVSIYVAYLTFSSLSLNPDEACNPSLRQDSSRIASTSVGVLLAFLSTAWTCVVTTRRLSAGLTRGALQGALLGVSSGRSDESSSTSSWCGICCNALGSLCGRGSSAEDLNTYSEIEVGDCESESVEEATAQCIDEYRGLRVAIVNAGVIFSLVPLYLSMALTDWGTAQDEDGERGAEINPEVGARSMWTQAVGMWCCLGLYIFSLVLPEFRIFPRSIWDLQPRLV